MKKPILAAIAGVVVVSAQHCGSGSDARRNLNRRSRHTASRYHPGPAADCTSVAGRVRAAPHTG